MPSKKPFLKKKSLGKRKAQKRAEPAASSKALVSKDMTFAELTGKFPAAIPILFEYGLHCIGCHVSALETIEQGAMMHGLSEEQLEEMLAKINEKAKK